MILKVIFKREGLLRGFMDSCRRAFSIIKQQKDLYNILRWTKSFKSKSYDIHNTRLLQKLAYDA